MKRMLETPRADVPTPPAGYAYLFMDEDGLVVVKDPTGAYTVIAQPGTGVGDLSGPASATDSAIVLFDSTTGKLVKDSAVTISTDGTMAANSDAKVATEKAIRTYIAAYVTANAVAGQASSVDNEMALFSGTGGKTIKRASSTGFVRMASGVVSAVDGSNDDFAQRKSGVWTNRTAAQAAADLQATGLDGSAAGFRGVPQNSQSGNYTTVAADAGKHIYHPASAGSGHTFTIAANASVAYGIGTAITFVNMDSNAVSIAITSDTMYLAGVGTTGTRTLAQYGVATAIKLTSTTWVISGSGLT